jgi:HSP20 family protein
MRLLHYGSLLEPDNPFKASRGNGDESAALDGITMQQPAGRNGSQWVPPVDILEGNREYLFEADLPQMKKTDVSVLVERDALFITGTRDLKEQENSKKSLCLERPHGYFVRRFALPEDACRAEIKARLIDGVLQIRVRKLAPHQKERPQPQRIEVDVA